MTAAAIRILLTHTPEMRRNYYGERALAGLRALGGFLVDLSRVAQAKRLAKLA